MNQRDRLWFPLLGFLLGISALLGALGCSGPSAPPQKELFVFNWSDYLDKDLIPEFEKRTGAKVHYGNYSSEAELEGKLQTGATGYDVVFPSDRSLSPLLKKGLLAEIDRSQLSNWKHLDEKFLGSGHDPENRFSVPYFWGTVAVGIRTDHVKKPVKGFEVLFDEEYKGRITMLDDPENVVAVAMMHLGFPMNSTEDAHLAKVKELLLRQAPLVQAYTSDGFKEKLIKDEAWVVLGWNGDLRQARDEEERIQVIVPESGTMIWADSIAIPANAKNKALAHEFINFLLDPDIAARNANSVKYPSPNKAARAKIDPKLLEDAAIYPPRDLLDRCQWLQDRGPAISKIERVWKEVRNR